MRAMTDLACAASYGKVNWHAIHWQKVNQNVQRLQARIVKATRCETASPDRGVSKGLSRMKRKFHVRFLGDCDTRSPTYLSHSQIGCDLVLCYQYPTRTWGRSNPSLR